VGGLKSILGSAVKTKRFQLGISQEELADRAGLHRTYISDVERGTRNLSLGSIEKLAWALELSVSTLFAAGMTNGNIPKRLVEILLVEDNAQDVEMTRRAFQKAKIANPMRVVSDGAEALDFLFATGSHSGRGSEPPPGVVLLDLDLPKVGGIEVLRRIKADRRTQKIPVIVLTSSDQDREMTVCRRLGIRMYIVKPVGFQNFSDIIPHLDMEWALIKASFGGKTGTGGKMKI
jgi:CheY-like chemotaxis protein